MSALLTVPKRQKLPKCPSYGGRIEVVHTVKYYVTLKRKAILTFATKRTAPEDMVLEKYSGHKRTNVL